MASLSGFIADNVYLVFFLKGLVFFAMGVRITCEIRRPSELQLASRLWLLSAYAFFACAGNWLQMSLVLTWAGHNAFLNALTASAYAIGAVFLLLFGLELVTLLNRKYVWLRWVCSGLVGLYLALLVLKLTGSGPDTDWLSAIEVTTRYVVYLPALALSGLALWLHRRVFLEMNLSPIAWSCAGAAAAFGLKWIAAVAAPPDLGLPATLISTMFVPIQLLRMAATLAVTVYVVRILNFFEEEHHRKLDQAVEEKLRAQQEALSAQRQTCEEIRHWSTSMADMVQAISATISQPIELHEIMGTVLKDCLRLTGLKMGQVFTLRDPDQAPVLIVQEGRPRPSPELATPAERVTVGHALATHAAQTGELLVIENLSQDERFHCPEARFHVSVPLKSKGRVTGILNLAGDDETRLTQRQIELLMAVGQQLGVAIENAGLIARLKSMATLEERLRLSRELHDGLAQVLGYLNLKSQVTQTLLQSDRMAEALVELKDIEDVTARAYDDVREEIYGLRLATSTGMDWRPSSGITSCDSASKAAFKWTCRPTTASTIRSPQRPSCSCFASSRRLSRTSEDTPRPATSRSCSPRAKARS